MTATINEPSVIVIQLLGLPADHRDWSRPKKVEEIISVDWPVALEFRNGFIAGRQGLST
jgi:hypothetical protein